jgi:CysZ protein
MIGDIFKGFFDYFKAFSYFKKGKLGLLAMAPGLLGAILGAVYIYVAYQNSDWIGAWLVSWYPWDWGSANADYISFWLTFILLVVVYLLLLKYIILILGGPFMSPFSERIEQSITGEPGSGSFAPSQFFKDIWRAIRINARNIVHELGFTLILLVLSLFPAFSPFTSAAIFLVGSYYAGFGNMDFTMERHFNYRESVDFVHRNRGVAIGNGIGFMLLFLIPVIGIFIALPLSTAASTITTVNKIKKEKETGHSSS